MNKSHTIYELQYSNNKRYIIQLWENDNLIQSRLINKRYYNSMVKNKYTNLPHVALRIKINHKNYSYISSILKKYHNYSMTPEQVTNCISRYNTIKSI